MTTIARLSASVGSVLLKMASEREFTKAYACCAARLGEVLEAGGTVWVGGNGGCASIADHFVGEFVGSRAPARGRLRCLVGSLAATTALANDLGFDRIFAERVTREASASDALLLFSVSGRSANVTAAVEAAATAGASVVLVSGLAEIPASPGLLRLAVPETTVEAVQAAQLTVAHALVTDLSSQARPPS